MSSESQTVNLLGESRNVLYGGEEGHGKESEVTIEKLYELMKNICNAINESLNTMSETN